MSDVLSKYDEAYDQSIGQKLRCLEELRPLLLQESIACPGQEAIELTGLVLIGQQAAGKSSILEGLTGVALPIAENARTRMPVILRLEVDHKVSGSQISVSRQADFKNAQLCNSMRDLQQVLREFDSAVASSGVPVNDKPVYIRYVRKAGPVFTLIDLPGISHHDPNEHPIHKVTVSMTNQYISNEKHIILVVSPALKEFGTEALALAEEIDKGGLRTIGVATKCDLVSVNSKIFLSRMNMEGEDNAKIKHGFIAVRSKLLGEEGKSIEEIESEFAQHAVLSQLDSAQIGFKALAQKIVQVQSIKLDAQMLAIKSTVQEKEKGLADDIKANNKEIELLRTQENDLTPTRIQKVKDTGTEQVRKVKNLGNKIVRRPRRNSNLEDQKAQKLKEIKDDLANREGKVKPMQEQLDRLQTILNRLESGGW